MSDTVPNESNETPKKLFSEIPQTSENIFFDMGHTRLLIDTGIYDEKYLYYPPEGDRRKHPMASIPVEFFLNNPKLKEDAIIDITVHGKQKEKVPAQKALFTILYQLLSQENPLERAASTLNSIGERTFPYSPNTRQLIKDDHARFSDKITEHHNNAVATQLLLNKLPGPSYDNRERTENSVQKILIKKENGDIMSIEEKQNKLNEITNESLKKIDANL